MGGDLPESSVRERSQQEKIIKELELRRKMQVTVVPTDDVKVRQMLRQLEEPVTLFGEREMERRERLRKVMAQRDAELAEAPAVGQLVVEEAAALRTELFYTEGPEELKEARMSIAHFSLKAAARRIAGAKRRREDVDLRVAAAQEVSDAEEQAKRLAQQSSEIGDDRPISGCEFSPSGHLLATCGWGGMIAIWSAAGCQKQFSARAHDERCTSIAWHPAATLTQSPTAVNLATACADSTAALIAANGQVLSRLSGHTDRLARLAFHPMGRHLATASFDMTWRLWDVEVGCCLVEQEGHSRGVYAVGFHPDGSLVGSAGLDAIGRIWDCRTGRSVFVMEGHVKQILSLDFSPNGYHIATGSDDHSCKVWDLRNKKCMYTIPGHRSLVSSVRYQRGAGAYIMSGGYDSVVKIWSAQNFSLLKTLAGHEGKVMCVDATPTGHLLASVSYDRTIKMWAPEEIPELMM
eukprot:CAMPEP_0202890186 /NCGR_PEP_ID=MMETSP1392-20130828/686_1 /ASSEMBLY_ACC=CAM_ASM_000868 /TAXON_ID=225041 /ORGANISM="Chlamydomonas chlamydogama, Strain SAG 11-48b" /LENGTH=463 /DNA_ID=CAMNT_0049573717 /DNA_START=97 /DNA_END=1488 /DNA_ORIENTATION=-